MKNLTHIKLEDIFEFLKIFGYEWSGLIKENDKLKEATIEDFKSITCLELKKQDKIIFLNVSIDDFNFYLENKTLNKKFNFTDHSTLWKAFMIQRKSIYYSKLLQIKTLSEKQKVEEMYNKKINLTQKLLDQIKYEKSLEMAKLNTTIYNVKFKLNKSETKQVDEINETNLRDSLN